MQHKLIESLFSLWKYNELEQLLAVSRRILCYPVDFVVSVGFCVSLGAFDDGAGGGITYSRVYDLRI